MNQIPHDEWTGKIIARINGELDSAESALFDSHVQSCSRCTQELKEYELLSRRLQALERNVSVPVLSPALLAVKREIAQVAQQRILDEAQHVLEKSFASGRGVSFSGKESPRSGSRETEEWRETPSASSGLGVLTLDLVMKARQGDDESFTMLFRLYYQLVYTDLYRMVRNREDASDLASVSFTRAWRGLPHLSDARRFRGWLHKIAVSVAQDHMRDEKRRNQVLQSMSILSENRSVQYPAHFEDEVEVRELIKFALKEVAPKPRACLLLYQEGFSQAEIAELMGMKSRSVGTYISNAREQFRRAYRRLQAP